VHLVGKRTTGRHPPPF